MICYEYLGNHILFLLSLSWDEKLSTVFYLYFWHCFPNKLFYNNFQILYVSYHTLQNKKLWSLVQNIYLCLFVILRIYC